jgi:tRNA U34 2-thiouridine synthase MnmA/TrmU
MIKQGVIIMSIQALEQLSKANLNGVRKLNKHAVKQAANNRELLVEYKDAYASICWDLYVTGEGNRDGYTDAMDAFWKALRMTDSNGNIVTYVGRDGKSYAEYKPYVEQMAICVDALEGYTEQEVRQIAAQRRKMMADRDAERQARFDEYHAANANQSDTIDQGRPEYANGEFFKNEYLLETINQLQADVDRLQHKAGNGGNANILRLLDAKSAQLLKARKLAEAVG